MSEKMKMSYQNATGAIRYRMTNDAMFHIALQGNDYALTGLIAALLHIDPSEIHNVEVRNPIHEGAIVDEKTVILDILVTFNEGTIIDLELQVKDLKNWVPRSIYYLSREFTRLYHGKDYNKVKPAYHVGFLDYTLFPEHPEFYAIHRLANIKDGHIYSDIFTLSVVDLNRIDLATEEDRRYEIDAWARIFKAKTWEELRMIAEKNKYLASTAQSIYDANQTEWVQFICDRREDEIRERVADIAKIEEQERIISEQTQKLSEKDQALSEKDQALSEKDQALSEKDQTLSQKDQQLSEQARIIEDLKKQLTQLQKKEMTSRSNML